MKDLSELKSNVMEAVVESVVNFARSTLKVIKYLLIKETAMILMYTKNIP